MSEGLQFEISVRDDGTATIRRFRGEVEATGSAAEKLGSRFSGLGAKLIELNQVFELGERVMRGLEGAYRRFIEPTVEAGEELLRLSRRFGTSVEDLQSLSAVAKASGVPIGELGYAFRTLSVQLAQAQRGGSDAHRVFDALGIKGKALGDLLKQNTSVQIKTLIDQFSQFKESPERFEALFKIFGRAAPYIQQIINTTKESREELDKFTQEFGVKMSKAAAIASDQITTNIAKIKIAFDGLSARIASADVRTAIANVIGNAAEQIGRLFKNLPQSTIDRFQGAIVKTAEAVGKFTVELGGLLVSPTVIHSFELLGDAFERIAQIMERIKNEGLFAGLKSFLSEGGTGTSAIFGAIAARSAGLGSLGSLAAGIGAGALAQSSRESTNLDPVAQRAIDKWGTIIGGAIGTVLGVGVGAATGGVGLGTTAALASGGASLGPAILRLGFGEKTITDLADTLDRLAGATGDLQTSVDYVTERSKPETWTETLNKFIGAVQGVFSFLADKVVTFFKDVFTPDDDTIAAIRDTISSALKSLFGRIMDTVLADFRGETPQWMRDQIVADAAKASSTSATVAASAADRRSAKVQGLAGTFASQPSPLPVGESPLWNALGVTEPDVSSGGGKDLPKNLGKKDPLTQKIEDLNNQIAALKNPALEAQVEIQKLTAELVKMGAAEPLAAKLASDFVNLKLDEQAVKQLESMTAAIRVAADPTQKFSVEIETIANETRRLGPDLQNVVVQMAKLKAEFDQLAQAGQAIGNLRGALEGAGFSQNEIADIGKQLETLAAPAVAQAVQHVEDLRQALAGLAKTDPNFDRVKAELLGAEGGVRAMTDGIASLEDRTAAATQQIHTLREAADKMGNTDLSHLLDQMEQIIKTTEKAKEVSTQYKASWFSITGAAEKGMTDVLAAVVAGTRKMSDVFEGLKVSIVGSLIEAFANGIKAKLGFDHEFTVNIAGLVENVANLFTGNQGGSLTSIFKDTFGIINAQGTQTYKGGLFDTLGRFFGIDSSGTTPSGSSATIVPASVVSAAAGGYGPLSGGYLSSSGTVSGYGASLPATGGGGFFSSFNTFGIGNLAKPIWSWLTGGGTAASASAGATGAGGAFGALAGGYAPAVALPTTFNAPIDFAGGATLPTTPIDFTATGGISAGTAPAASAASTLLAWAGLALSLGLGGYNLAKDRSSFDKVTLGTANAQNNRLTGLGAGMIAGFTAAGAGIGAAFSVPTYGLSIPIGAAIGASVGSAVSSAINSAVTGGIAKGLGAGANQTVTGITQSGLTASVNEGLKKSWSRYLAIVLTAGINEVAGAAFGAAVTPNVEKIVAKLFRQTLGKAGLSTTGVSGSTNLSGSDFDLNSTELTGVVRLLSSLSAGGVGAEGNRLNRLRQILLGGLQRAQSQGNRQAIDNPEQFLAELIPQVVQNNVLPILRVIKQTPDKLRDQVLSAAASGFQESLAGFDTNAVFDTETADGTRFLRTANAKKSRQAVRAAVPELFSQPGDTGIARFTDALTKAIQAPFEKLAQRLVVNSPIGVALGDVFDLSKQAKKMIRKQGLNDETLDFINNQLTEKAADFAKILNEEGGKKFLENMQKVFDLGFKFTVQLKLAAGDIAGATEVIEQRLAPFTQIVEAAKEGKFNLENRVTQLTAGAGTVAQSQAQIEVARRNTQRARDLLLVNTPLGNALKTEEKWGGLADISGYIKQIFDTQDPQKALQLLQDYATARLDELQTELDTARQLKKAFEQLHDAAQGLVDQTDIQRRGPRAVANIVERQKAQIESLIPGAFDAGNPDLDKLAKIEQLLPELLNQASQIYAPGSKEYEDIFNYVDQVSRRLEAFTGGEENKYALEEARIQKEAEKTKSIFEPLFQGFIGQGTVTLQDQLQQIADILGAAGNTSVRGILQSIAEKFGVSFTNTGLGPNNPRATPYTDVTDRYGNTATQLPGGGLAQAVLTNDAGIALEYTPKGSNTSQLVTNLLLGEWVKVNDKFWAMLEADDIATWIGANPPGDAGGQGKQGKPGPILPVGDDGGRAWGGAVYPGRSYNIGEFGRETFTADQFGWVRPGGGGQPVEVNLTINLSGANAQTAKDLAEILRTKVVPELITQIQAVTK